MVRLPVNRERGSTMVEDFTVKLDAAAEELGRDGDGSPRISSGESRIVKGFPYFVVIALLIWLVAVFYLDEFEIPDMLELLCLSFVFCFAILGVPCSMMMSKGLFNGWTVALFATCLSLLLWVFGAIYGDFSFLVAVSDMLGAIGIHLSGLTREVVCFLATLAVVLFTSIGVTSVISSYMRAYMPKVFSSMSDHAKTGVRGKAERFFMVPDIIDVRGVVLDSESEHAFDLGRAVSISVYLFVLGLLVSSYLFVNPYFLDVMDWKTMLSITLMLSMFTPALILPWQIVRCVGARVRSDAPRDYYLWEGAKHRLFTTFATLGAFMMMFLLSVYMGNDVERIILNYLSFLVPLLVTSVMYGLLYANNFENADRRIICERYEKGRESRHQ